MPSICISDIWLCCNLLCLMLVTRARVAWSYIWTYYWIIMIVLFVILSASCVHIIVRIQWPRNNRNWDNRRGWLWCEDHMCSRSVNALLRCSIKRSTLIASSSLEAPLQRAGRTKYVVQVLIASTHDYIWSTCLWLFSTWMIILIYMQLP